MMSKLGEHAWSNFPLVTAFIQVPNEQSESVLLTLDTIQVKPNPVYSVLERNGSALTALQTTVVQYGNPRF